MSPYFWTHFATCKYWCCALKVRARSLGARPTFLGRIYSICSMAVIYCYFCFGSSVFPCRLNSISFLHYFIYKWLGSSCGKHLSSKEGYFWSWINPWRPEGVFCSGYRSAAMYPRECTVFVSWAYYMFPEFWRHFEPCRYVVLQINGVCRKF